MSQNRSIRQRSAPVATLLGALALLAITAAPAGADPVGAGEASAFGATVSAGGQEVIPPTPTATATLPGDASETTIDIPADPVAISGTLNADAAVHAESDIASRLVAVDQAIEGPYNAAAVGSIEEAEVLVDAVAADVSLLTADAIRAEAVGVCRAGVVEYSANSEIVNLNIGGTDVPLNAPVQDLIDAIGDVLEETTLNQVVDVQRNVITESADGIAVDALVVTVLAAAGEDPLAEVRLGRAEVNGVACAAVTECNDGVDNADPEDDFADEADPQCHTDGNADNPDSYDPTIASETAAPVVGPAAPVAPPAAGRLPATGGDATSTAGLAAVMAAGALGAVALRRRLG